LALGITAPVASLTVPWIVTVETCAETAAVEAAKIESITRREKMNRLLMVAPLFRRGSNALRARLDA
jgi:hypothetical protein